MRRSVSGKTRIVVHPCFSHAEGIDVTDQVIDAVAAEIDRLHSGNHVLNRLEAEMLVENLLEPEESRTWTKRHE